MCFQLSYTLFQCLASWDANNLYIFLSQIHLHWRFDILNTIPNTSSNILLLYHTCLEVQTFIHREDHVKTPKLKVHFRSRRSAQIKLKKKQNLILKFRSSFKRNNAPATFHKPPQGEIPKTTRFILERLRENTKQMNARIDQILPLPIWKTYSEPRNELGTRNDLVIFGRGLPSMFSNIPKKHPLLYTIKQVKDALKKSRILFLITTRKETCNNVMV